MAMENDANTANYSETRAHINLSKKLLEAEKPGTDPYTESMADLSMYFERLVQLKQMRIQTLEVTREEDESTKRKLKEQCASSNVKVTILLRVAFFALAAIMCWLWPIVLTASREAIEPYCTIDRIGAILFLVLWSNRRLFY
jgi:hypothetical protein